MFKRRFIISCSAFGAIMLGSLIDHLCGFDKGYFAVSLAALFAGYWIVEFLIDLISYYMFYENDYKIFIAEKVNKTMLNYDDIMAKEKYYFKEFKRTRVKGKLYGYTKVIFTMGLFIFLVVCLF